MAGTMVATIVMNIAAIWLRVTLEASRPMPVEAKLNTSAPSSRVAKLPVTATPNTVTASRLISAKLTIASATYGSCLPIRNSLRVTGVT